MKNTKGNILLKLHNCFFCHKGEFFNKIYPKIEYQYRDYIIWSIKQYQFNYKKNFFNRNNFIMKTQIQNLSLFDIKNIAIELSFIN